MGSTVLWETALSQVLVPSCHHILCSTNMGESISGYLELSSLMTNLPRQKYSPGLGTLLGQGCCPCSGQ